MKSIKKKLKQELPGYTSVLSVMLQAYGFMVSGLLIPTLVACLMKLEKEDEGIILSKLDQMVAARGYTKIIAKVPDRACDMFCHHGYQIECSIPGFYKGEDTVNFMSHLCGHSHNTLIIGSVESMNVWYKASSRSIQ